MFFVAPYPVYPRVPVERLFKGLYQLANLAHAISLIVLTTEFWVRMETSFAHYIPLGNAALSPGLSAVMGECQYNGIIQIGGVQITVEVTGATISTPLMLMAQHVIVILAVQFLAIINNALAMGGYSSGCHHLRILGVHVPLYHIVTTLSFVYSIVLVVLVWVVYPLRVFYTDAIAACARDLYARDSIALLAAEYDGYHIFGTPIEWAFAATVVNAFIYVAGLSVLIKKSIDPATVLLSQSEVPWEKRGVTCKTDKAALRIHTTAREAILKEARAAIDRGEEVRIARGYALMTEAAYQAQVEEMRRCFAEQVKEQHFEHLRTYFERESDLDEGGLHWRQQQQQQHGPHYQYHDDFQETSKLQLTPTMGPMDVADQFIDVKWSPLDAGFPAALGGREQNGSLQDGNHGTNGPFLGEADGGISLPFLHHKEENHRQTHRRRRHRRRDNRENSLDSAVELDLTIFDDGALLQPADELQEELHGTERVKKEDVSLHQQRNGHGHRRRHRQPQERSHTTAGRNVDSEMDEEMVASPLEKADEL